jgi:hypothetical protein
MQSTRLKVPAQSGAMLAEPPLDRVDDLIRQNQLALGQWRYDFQGRSSAQVRAMTRAAVHAAAGQFTAPTSAQPATSAQSSILDQLSVASGPQPSTPARRDSEAPDARPYILSGHQPELFHPGVWIKNLAGHWLARRAGGVSLHLIVDNDTVKRTTVRVPTGSLTEPSIVHVPLDRWQGEIPYEQYEVADEAVFASFGQRVAEAVRTLGIEPLARPFWPLAVESARSTGRLGERLALARRRQEQRWGCRNRELPVSRLCQTEGFYWFACRVLAQLGPFREQYNRALAEYRRRNKIRSHNHPVPPLERDGDWLEAPFWIWSDRDPRRRRLFAQPRGRELILTDRHEWTCTLPLSPDREACCAVELLAGLPGRGIKIRTRALTTTIFTRLFLADLFIHGLGGARYDELSDEIIRHFFGLEPPRFLALTATLHVPIRVQQATAEQARQLQRRLRDLEYNPDRHLGTAANDEAARLVEQKWEAIRTEPTSRLQRRNRFERIRQLNQSLAECVAPAQAAVAGELARVDDLLRANAILENREWAFCVYPEASLHGLFRPFLGEAV